MLTAGEAIINLIYPINLCAPPTAVPLLRPVNLVTVPALITLVNHSFIGTVDTYGQTAERALIGPGADVHRLANWPESVLTVLVPSYLPHGSLHAQSVCGSSVS